MSALIRVSMTVAGDELCDDFHALRYSIISLGRFIVICLFRSFDLDVVDARSASFNEAPSTTV